MKPMYTPKKPISAIMYRALYSPRIISLPALAMLPPANTSSSPARNTQKPCPMSPYMTPKRKGKVAAVNRAGLASP